MPPEIVRKGSEVLLFTGVLGVLPSLIMGGLSLACMDSLFGTTDPPLPPLFIAGPPTVLPDIELGAGEGVADCLLPIFRI